MVKKKQIKRFIKNLGLIFIFLTPNNCIITITDIKGNVFLSSSPGHHGFTGYRKSTTFAHQVTAKILINKALALGLIFTKIFIKQTGAGLEPLLKLFKDKRLKILSIWDITPLSHNGCRPPKKRRV
jgi:small subunit ribosomal protein S11